MRSTQILLIVCLALSAAALAAALVPVARAGPGAVAPGLAVADRADHDDDRPTPTATRIAVGGVCPDVGDGRVPNDVFNRVFIDPSRTGGWGELCHPSLPPSIWNVRRSWLSLVDPAKPYHPLFNGMVWKCGCR